MLFAYSKILTWVHIYTTLSYFLKITKKNCGYILKYYIGFFYQKIYISQIFSKYFLEPEKYKTLKWTRDRKVFKKCFCDIKKFFIIRYDLYLNVLIK